MDAAALYAVIVHRFSLLTFVIAFTELIAIVKLSKVKERASTRVGGVFRDRKWWCRRHDFTHTRRDFHSTTVGPRLVVYVLPSSPVWSTAQRDFEAWSWRGELESCGLSLLRTVPAFGRVVVGSLVGFVRPPILRVSESWEGILGVFKIGILCVLKKAVMGNFQL